jgi:YVTN family beta-propeller protein
MENSSEIMDLSVGVPMTAWRVARLAAVLILALICLSCGDTFRPVAIPVTPPPPDPRSFHYILMVSDNGADNPGASTRIDVSGDTNVGVAKLGLGPVHATLLPNGSKIYVANSLENTVSVYSPADATTVTTVSLSAPGSAPANPVFVHTTQNDTVYVANSGNNTVSVISTATNAVTHTVSVGINPIALAETPDGKKLFVANQGTGANGSVNSISTVDNSSKAVTPFSTPWVSPAWVVTRNDSAKAYVLDSGSGLVSTIDTFSDLAINEVGVGVGANFMFYDKARNRLYITNPGSTNLVVLDASADLPALLPAIDLATGSGSICATACIPTAVAVLPDGSRAYVVSYVPGNPAISQVSVIDAQSNTVRKVIPLNPGNIDSVNPTGCSTARFRLFTVAAAGGSRVYVSNCDAGSTAIILTSDDTLVVDLKDNPLLIPAPFSSFKPPNAGDPPPPQNPVFLLSGP